MIILSGCKTASCNKMPIITLPNMPIAGDEVGNELKLVCSPPAKCINLNNWLNELYIFKAKYIIYKEGLK
jgi:hypothetical protein